MPGSSPIDALNEQWPISDCDKDGSQDNEGEGGISLDFSEDESEPNLCDLLRVRFAKEICEDIFSWFLIGYAANGEG